MSKFEIIVATTHKDIEGDMVTKEALENVMHKNKNSSKKLLFLQEHDFTLPPLGLIVDYKLKKRSDGEYELIGIVESWEELNVTEKEERMKRAKLPYEILQKNESFLIFNNRGSIYRKESNVSHKKVKNLRNHIGKYNLLKISDEMSLLRNGIEFNTHILPYDALFRRRCSIKNAYNLDLIDALVQIWTDNRNIEIAVCIDFDLHLERASGEYREKDYWRGPKFTKKFNELRRGVTEHAPSEYDSEKDFRMEFWIKNQDKQTKVIELEEINNNEIYSRFHDEPIFHFTKYCHAEFDLENNYVRHFDIAIRLYKEEQYQRRRTNTIDKVGKKFNRRKIIKIDGEISIDEMLHILYMFFRGNTLLQEYFEEKRTDSAAIENQKYTSFAGELKREIL
ncbi:MAG: hypothetical protein ACXADY_25490 [Candidatus Hodarchaeales archaeon]|jgi:hypothetical protein